MCLKPPFITSNRPITGYSSSCSLPHRLAKLFIHQDYVKQPAFYFHQTLGKLLPLGPWSETGSHYVDKADLKLTESTCLCFQSACLLETKFLQHVAPKRPAWRVGSFPKADSLFTHNFSSGFVLCVRGDWVYPQSRKNNRFNFYERFHCDVVMFYCDSGTYLKNCRTNLSDLTQIAQSLGNKYIITKFEPILFWVFSASKRRFRTTATNKMTCYKYTSTVFFLVSLAIQGQNNPTQRSTKNLEQFG